MNIDWSRVLPVIVSIFIIISIAILRQYSRTIASIAAVMPINVPLGLWIVSSGGDITQEALTEFSQGLLINIIPTVIYIFVAWQMIKAGQPVLTAIIVSYVVWAVSLGAIFLVRAWLSPQ